MKEPLKARSQRIRLALTRWLGGHSGLIGESYQWMPSDGGILSHLSNPFHCLARCVVRATQYVGPKRVQSLTKSLCRSQVPPFLPGANPVRRRSRDRVSGFARRPYFERWIDRDKPPEGASVRLAVPPLGGGSGKGWESLSSQQKRVRR